MRAACGPERSGRPCRSKVSRPVNGRAKARCRSVPLGRRSPGLRVPSVVPIVAGVNLATLHSLASRRFRMNLKGIHGPSHWERVHENGIYLAEKTAANKQVVQAFAFLHDCCRETDDLDPAHGRRAASFARSIRHALEMPDEAIELLLYACAHHTDGALTDHPTIGACWDADRLDLGRVGIKPRPQYLSTEESKKPAVIAWAYRRSRGLPYELPT